MKKTITLKVVLLSFFFFVTINYSSYSQNSLRNRQRNAITSDHSNKAIHKNLINNMKVDTLNNIVQSISNVLFGGCVCISNLTYTGPHLSIGYFVDTTGTLGIDSGLVMTTGSVIGIEDSASYFASTSNNMPGDSLLNTLIPGYTTYDASIIEFDFVPLADTIIGCNYIFGSEEYPEYVGSSFNDIFGFFISGPGIAGVQNIAMIPGTSIPVAINNVNADSNSLYYVDNTYGANWCYDGYTTPFTLYYPVTPDSLYHFKIATADAGDNIFDSGVFLKGGSFLGNTPMSIAKFSSSIDSSSNTVTFTNQSVHASVFSWDFGDGTGSISANPTHTYTSAGNYIVKLVASNRCNSDSIIHLLNLSVVAIPNESIHSFTLSTIEQGLYALSFSLNVPSDIQICVFNCNGQIVFNEKANNSNSFSGLINLHDYADGLYFLNIKNGTNSLSYKIIK